MNDIIDTDLLPMREIVRLTGVNPVTLRAWERRYGLVNPIRTEGGHRMYTRGDLQIILDILLWSSRGIAVGKIGELLAKSRRPEPEQADDELLQWREAFERASAAFDLDTLDRLYGQAYSLYPILTLLEDILQPLWRSLLTLNTFGSRSQWLFLDAFLRSRVLMHLQMSRTSEAYVLLSDATGNLREFELLAMALMLSNDGVQVRPLSPGAPLEELPLLCQAMQPAALVLLAHVALAGEGFKRLERLQLAIDCPLAVTGEAAQDIASELRGVPLADLGNSPTDARRRLRALVQGKLQL
ncbi:MULTISPECIES: MerR family transcriptional regulator [Pseudomonas]|uniref:MerR family transcriptional regulator n=1 Tax=Pseudomonas TaxID=286 RepID=UPI00053F278A|nr:MULTISPECIES: MerR family transcriptional regulator [Pseudomonas]HBQ8682339.1 MerR family transcriptional regulator [Klebsiella pneumoniae]EIU3493137.1 MerR family transcriptional regulator [Pseudomonas aeruginosa]KSQ36058.1 MerR family transcriptional regulator [Pseudomonas aeruginosa]MBA4944018.1 MerR family transcriptional regulator [Pseudomonas aeruginosa]MBK1797806.1 MerR family transcriptional regulator [Pseudomonas aeruginosa]